jgi:CDP-diacylglycerol--serine O-phosphatidyltransferase
LTRVTYQPGRFLPPIVRIGAQNERTELWVEREGRTVVFRQVVGVLARRVVCRVREGETVQTGDRFGLMKFGSRMDVFVDRTRGCWSGGRVVRAGRRGSPSSARPDSTERTVPVLRARRFVPKARVDGARMRRGAYLLPSLLTLGNLFCGYACVIFALRHAFEQAAMFIGFAIVLDMLDGRVARMTGTSSAFGVEFDSLADVISFGMAPAILSFAWGLQPLGRLGWAVGFLFVSAAAIRLARFNIQTNVPGVTRPRRHAEPAAAGVPRRRSSRIPTSSPAGPTTCWRCRWCWGRPS